MADEGRNLVTTPAGWIAPSRGDGTWSAWTRYATLWQPRRGNVAATSRRTIANADDSTLRSKKCEPQDS